MPMTLRMAGQGGDILWRRDRFLRRVMRMDADGAPEVRLRRRDRRQASRLRQRGADGHHPAHAQPPRRAPARPARSAVGVVVEVAVGIDQHARRPARRSAGTRPAAPAAAMPSASGRAESGQLPRLRRHPELVQHPRHAVRHERLQHAWRSPAARPTQHPQHRRHPRRIGPAQRPRRLAVDVAIGGADDLPDLLQRLVEHLAVQPLAQRAGQRLPPRQQLRIVLGGRPPRPAALPRSCARSATASAAPGCPRSFASSTLIRVISAWCDSVPSPPNGFSRSRK